MSENTSEWEKPSPRLMNFFLMSQKQIAMLWKEIAWKCHLSQTIKEKLLVLDPLDWLDCSDHGDAVKDELLQLITTRIINMTCTDINREIRSQKVKAVRQAQKKSLKSKNVPEDYGLQDINQTDWEILTGLQGK